MCVCSGGSLVRCRAFSIPAPPPRLTPVVTDKKVSLPDVSWGGPPSRAAVLGPRNPEADKTVCALSDFTFLQWNWHINRISPGNTVSPVSPFKVPICTFGTRQPWFACNCSQGPMGPGAPAAGLGARAVWGRHQHRDDVGTIPEKWELHAPPPHPHPPPVYMNDRRQPWASVLCTLITSLMASY